MFTCSRGRDSSHGAMLRMPFASRAFCPTALLRVLRVAQVIISWLLQRGLLAVPRTKYPDQSMLRSPENYSEWLEDVRSRCAEVFSLIHPFTRRPTFCSEVNAKHEHPASLQLVPHLRLLSGTDYFGIGGGLVMRTYRGTFSPAD